VAVELLDLSVFEAKEVGARDVKLAAGLVAVAKNAATRTPDAHPIASRDSYPRGCCW
jgi:hypothetical protein